MVRFKPGIQTVQPLHKNPARACQRLPAGHHLRWHQEMLTAWPCLPPTHNNSRISGSFSTLGHAFKSFPKPLLDPFHFSTPSQSTPSTTSRHFSEETIPPSTPLFGGAVNLKNFFFYARKCFHSWIASPFQTLQPSNYWQPLRGRKYSRSHSYSTSSKPHPR
jgi:hypothetical protein